MADFLQHFQVKSRAGIQSLGFEQLSFQLKFLELFLQLLPDQLDRRLNP